MTTKVSGQRAHARTPTYALAAVPHPYPLRLRARARTHTHTHATSMHARTHTRTHACLRPPARRPARKHTHTHTHTHTQHAALTHDKGAPPNRGSCSQRSAGRKLLVSHAKVPRAREQGRQGESFAWLVHALVHAWQCRCAWRRCPLADNAPAMVAMRVRVPHEVGAPASRIRVHAPARVSTAWHGCQHRSARIGCVRGRPQQQGQPSVPAHGQRQSPHSMHTSTRPT